MTSKWNEYMKSEGFKDYYCIEAYQYITEESARSEVIRKIEGAKSAEEAKAIIAKARGSS